MGGSLTHSLFGEMSLLVAEQHLGIKWGGSGPSTSSTRDMHLQLAGDTLLCAGLSERNERMRLGTAGGQLIESCG